MRRQHDYLTFKNQINISLVKKIVLTFIHLFDRHEISSKYDEAVWTQFARNTQPCVIKSRLRVVPIFSSGIVEQTKRERA